MVRFFSFLNPVRYCFRRCERRNVRARQSSRVFVLNDFGDPLPDENDDASSKQCHTNDDSLQLCPQFKAICRLTTDCAQLDVVCRSLAFAPTTVAVHSRTAWCAFWTPKNATTIWCPRCRPRCQSYATLFLLLLADWLARIQTVPSFRPSIGHTLSCTGLRTTHSPRRLCGPSIVRSHRVVLFVTAIRNSLVLLLTPDEVAGATCKLALNRSVEPFDIAAFIVERNKSTPVVICDDNGSGGYDASASAAAGGGGLFDDEDLGELVQIVKKRKID